jgi:hypothetical protein
MKRVLSYVKILKPNPIIETAISTKPATKDLILPILCINRPISGDSVIEANE